MIKKFNKHHKKFQMSSAKQLLKKMKRKTDDEIELDDFVKRMNTNYRKKRKEFKALYGQIGTSIAHT